MHIYSNTKHTVNVDTDIIYFMHFIKQLVIIHINLHLNLHEVIKLQESH